MQPPWGLRQKVLRKQKPGLMDQFWGSSVQALCPSFLSGYRGAAPPPSGFLVCYLEGVVSVGCGECGSSRGHTLPRGRAAW